MPKRTYCFTAMTEMRGVMGSSSWAKPTMREAITLGTGPWLCLFVNDEYRAAVDVTRALVTVGFRYAYELAKQEKDSRKLAKAAIGWRFGKLPYAEFNSLRSEIQQKYARQFESNPLIVAGRLAADNPCAVASAAFLDCVKLDEEAEWDIGILLRDYARRVIRL